MIFKDIAEYEEIDSQLSKDTILRLHKEIEELKNLCDKYEEEHRTTFEEWKKTIAIIDELEKDLKGKIDEDRLNILSNSHWKYILDKLQELKGVDKE